jgi:hypothetical protein
VVSKISENPKRRLGRALSLAGFVAAFLAAPAHAAPFEFAPAPQTDLNRVYRVDKATGEVGACQFQLKEGGIFRANVRTGEMSICYVFDDKVVCTPQAK